MSDQPGQPGLARPISRKIRLAVVLAALIVLALTAISPHPYDFCAYYSAGRLAQEQGPSAAFDVEGLNERHSKIHINHKVGPFYYSPLLLVPATLLSRLDFETAQTANQILLLIALGIILWFVLEPERPPWLFALLAVAFIACDPARIQFLYQNWTSFLVLFVVLALRQTREGHDRSAALFWALSFHVKLWAVLFLVPLWLAGRRKLVLSAVVVSFLLLLLPFPWTGVDAPVAFVTSLAGEAGGATEVFFNQISIPSTLARFARSPVEWVSSRNPVSHPGLKILTLAALTGYLALIWRRRTDTLFCLAITIPFLLLFGPKMWDHGELLFMGLFVLAILPRRVEALAAIILVTSFAYFELVQSLLRESLETGVASFELHTLLFLFPLLNLLAAAALLGKKTEPATE